MKVAEHFVGADGSTFKIYSPFKLQPSDILVAREDESIMYYVAKPVPGEANCYYCRVVSDNKDSMVFKSDVKHMKYTDDVCVFTQESVKIYHHFPITLLQ